MNNSKINLLYVKKVEEGKDKELKKENPRAYYYAKYRHCKECRIRGIYIPNNDLITCIDCNRRVCRDCSVNSHVTHFTGGFKNCRDYKKNTMKKTMDFIQMARLLGKNFPCSKISDELIEEYKNVQFDFENEHVEAHLRRIKDKYGVDKFNRERTNRILMEMRKLEARKYVLKCLESL